MHIRAQTYKQTKRYRENIITITW